MLGTQTGSPEWWPGSRVSPATLRGKPTKKKRQIRYQWLTITVYVTIAYVITIAMVTT